LRVWHLVGDKDFDNILPEVVRPGPRLRGKGLGFRGMGLGFRGKGLGFRFRAWGIGVRV